MKTIIILSSLQISHCVRVAVSAVTIQYSICLTTNNLFKLLMGGCNNTNNCFSTIYHQRLLQYICVYFIPSFKVSKVILVMLGDSTFCSLWANLKKIKTLKTLNTEKKMYIYIIILYNSLIIIATY